MTGKGSFEVACRDKQNLGKGSRSHRKGEGVPYGKGERRENAQRKTGQGLGGDEKIKTGCRVPSAKGD